MDSFKSEFKTLFDKLSKYTETLEESNNNLREALRSLLNEDDIKELPAYTLLKLTYEPYLEAADHAVVKNQKAQGQTQLNQPAIYDPLHAPPSSRYGAKKSTSTASATDNIRRPLAMAAAPVVVAKETEQHYSSQMPDMNSCLLGVAPTPKIQVKAKEKEKVKDKAPLKIQPKTDETVYRVEIQGKNYLRYNDCLYDETTKLRAGKLDDFKLGTTAEPMELEPLSDYPNYYHGSESTVYILINGELAQAVGTYENGELALWS